MGDIPFDAQRVVDELKAARREAAASAPRYWIPSESYDSAITSTPVSSVHLNDHLAWMHANWDLRDLLAPPRQSGLRGAVRWMVHRGVMAVFGPYFDRIQDYVGVNVRALDAVSKRVDDDLRVQLQLIEALRSEVIDFAHHVDERENG
jgi:hypothetical protein